MSNEKRLILLDNALQAVSENYRSDMPKHDLDMLVATRKRLKAMPTVDAVEVVHGRWECTYDEATGETDVTCSHCKNTRTVNGCYVTTKGESCYFEDNYCPNCGAKMDGERKDNG